MKQALTLAALLTLAACATKPAERPEPIIRTVEVKVPVTVPCPALAAMGEAPAYPDTDAALAAAPNLYQRVRLLVAGRLLRITREASTDRVMRACR